jgi:hypothetical protein
MDLTNKLRNASVVATLGILLAPGAVLAEKIDCSGSKKSKQQLSWQAIKPGDRPDREMVQFVRLDVISSKNPDFDGAEQTVYGHIDQIGGTGTESGYAVATLKSGEKLWAKWEGTQYLVPKGGDAWEIPYLGVFRYIAGTGKYKAIRGGGYYKGVATPAGLTEESVCEAEY